MQMVTDGRPLTGSAKRVFLTPAAPVLPAMDQALDLGLGWALRARQPIALVALRLSHLHEPGPRPHHRRIAANLLDSTIQIHGGQVFACPNGDMALVTGPEAAARLVSTLATLFRAESPGSDRLLALWSLPADEALARASLSAPAPQSVPPAEAPVPLGAIAAAEAIVAAEPLASLMRRQVAVMLVRAVAGHAPMVPLFQELSVSLEALEARMGSPAPFAADPFLFRHLATRLDQRVLGGVLGGLPAGGPAVHLNLTVAGILSPAFARLAAALPAETPWGVEVAFIEAVADLPRFAEAAARLREAGCRVVLDGVDHAVLALARPRALPLDLLKLDWSPRMASLPGRERRLLDAAVEAVGPDRMVLHRAETEAALAWGLARGITRFQGRHVDAMLAASRLGACQHATGCTLRQCISRANGTAAADRAGCRDLALLDAAMPPVVRAAAM